MSEPLQLILKGGDGEEYEGEGESLWKNLEKIWGKEVRCVEFWREAVWRKFCQIASWWKEGSVSAVEGHKLSPVWLASSITWSSVRFAKISHFDSRTASILFEI